MTLRDSAGPSEVQKSTIQVTATSEGYPLFNSLLHHSKEPEKRRKTRRKTSKTRKIDEKKGKKRKKWLNKTPAESGRRLRLHRSLIVIFIVKNGSF